MPSITFSRPEIQEIVGNNPSLIRKFEQLFQMATETTPTNVDDATVLASIAGQLASDAREAAQAAQDTADDVSQLRALIDSSDSRFKEIEAYLQTLIGRLAECNGTVRGPTQAANSTFALFRGPGGDELMALSALQASAVLQSSGLDADSTGFRGTPINSQSGNYSTAAGDAGKTILHPNGAGAGDTITISSNASVAYEIGCQIHFVNMDTNAVSIAIDTDTLFLSPAGTTGTRTLAQYGQATARKVATTQWLIWGTGLT